MSSELVRRLLDTEDVSVKMLGEREKSIAEYLRLVDGNVALLGVLRPLPDGVRELPRGKTKGGGSIEVDGDGDAEVRLEGVDGADSG